MECLPLARVPVICRLERRRPCSTACAPIAKGWAGALFTFPSSPSVLRTVCTHVQSCFFVTSCDDESTSYGNVFLSFLRELDGQGRQRSTGWERKVLQYRAWANSMGLILMSRQKDLGNSWIARPASAEAQGRKSKKTPVNPDLQYLPHIMTPPQMVWKTVDPVSSV